MEIALEVDAAVTCELNVEVINFKTYVGQIGSVVDTKVITEDHSKFV